MKTILLQGDSITDARRDRTIDAVKGYGYATIASGQLQFSYPNKYQIFNRGVSGNRTKDLCERFEQDFVALQPDYMSILIGINDVWHGYQNAENGLNATQSEFYYDKLLSGVAKYMPNTKTFLIEPFFLFGSATAEHFDGFTEQVALRRAITKKMAEKYKLPFVPMQDKLNKLQQDMPTDYYLRDGVHPTCAGHYFLAQEWLKAFFELEK